MHHLVEAYIEPTFAAHYVGNKYNEEPLLLSDRAQQADEDLQAIFKEYFLTPFKSEEYYEFRHSSDIVLNEVYTFVKTIFEDPKNLQEESLKIAKHLYEQSLHQNIKGGELYVVYIRDCYVDGHTVDAIGLFKSENRETFLDVAYSANAIEVTMQEGININKLDKGCLIFNKKKDEGYMLSIVDGTNKSKEAVYWKDDFLNVLVMKNEYHQTNEFLGVAKQYMSKQITEDFEVAKADQIDLLNRSMTYFKNHETFNKQDFEEKVLADENVIESFRNFETSFKAEHKLEYENDFDISGQAVKKQNRFFKSILKLDKNFHIYIHGNKELIQQGEDDNGRKFYKIYYTNET